MQPYYQDSAVTLYHGDALELLPELPENSVDLIACDPPYFRTADEGWDRQWKKRNEFLDWLDAMAQHWQRVLRSNGSLYCFASPWNARDVENVLARRFHLFPRISWLKSTGRHQVAKKEDLRSYFPRTEALIFAEHYGQDSTARGETSYTAPLDDAKSFVFEPIRAYLDAERKRAGLTPRQVNDGLRNNMAGHYFGRSQWTLPTRDNYEKLQALFNRAGQAEVNRAPAERREFLPDDWDKLRADYDHLRADYEELRTQYLELRRPFHVTKSDPYTDVWEFNPEPSANDTPRHPTQKPIAMMKHIIQASSQPGGVVLDNCAGSGTTLRAAKDLGRRVIGCELDACYVQHAAARCRQEVLL